MARSTVNPELNIYVSEALLAKSKSYEELKTLLRDCRQAVEQDSDNEEALAQLCTLINTLTANVSAINERRHEALVSEILGIRLWGAHAEMLTAVLEFTRNLVVANSAFTHTCLQLIVYSFTPPPALALAADAAQDPHGPWRPSDQALAVHQPLLAVLIRVLGLMPTAATNMLPLLVAQMPHKLRDRNTQCLYLSALFRIAEDRAGAPIKEAVLTAVIEHLLSVDIEIKWEDIVDVPTGEEEEEDDDVHEDMFELEELLANELDINAPPEELARRQEMIAMRHGGGKDGRGGWEGATAGGQPQQQRVRPPVDEMANKMDSMMELALEHIKKRIGAGDLRPLWDTLLSAFERTILNTHRSKFTQFLLFYVCIRNPAACAPSFVRFLLNRLRDSRHPAITRAACAAYLASFLARAAFLPEPMVVKALEELAAFCVQYGNAHGGGGTAAAAPAGSIAAAGGQVPGGAAGGELAEAMPFAGLMELGETAASLTQRHQVFYAAIQAVLYVLCYHLQPLVGEHQQLQKGTAGPAQANGAAGADTPGGGRGTVDRAALAEAVIRLVRGPVWNVLNHKLQPLGVCLPSVAAEFVHQAASLGIVNCRPMLRQIKLAGRSQRPLEMFFPFDPYLLKRSSKYLALSVSYVRWKHGHPQAAAGAASAGAEDAEAADSEDDDDEEESEEEEAAAAPGAKRAGVSEDDDGEGDSDGSSQEGSEDDEDDDEELPDPSMPSDNMLHDPTHRLHGASKLGPKHLAGPGAGVAGVGVGAHAFGQHHHHHHHHQSHHNNHRGGHTRGLAGGGILGTSYMSYASAETGSQGDGGMSPYGMSPHDVGDMLVQNPLGASPGAVPMSLGTPEMNYIAQVPMRIGRR